MSKSLYEGDFVVPLSEPPKIAPMTLAHTAGTFYLAGTASVIKERHGLHFMARTYSDNDEESFGVSYFINYRSLEEAGGPEEILHLVIDQMHNELKRTCFVTAKSKDATDCSDSGV